MTETTAPTQSRRTGLLIWMIIAQLLMLGSLVIWLISALFSVMAFDAGVTTQAWTFVIIVWSYPILPILLSIVGWIAYAKRKNTLAVILSVLSFAPPFLLYFLMIVSNLAWFAQNGG
jgi:hypothetical protein